MRLISITTLAGSLQLTPLWIRWSIRFCRPGVPILLFLWVVVTASEGSSITTISHTIEIPGPNRTTLTRAVSHEIHHEETVASFTGDTSVRHRSTFVGLGDGHVATWLEHVYRDGDDWVKEEGWYFSNGTFKADPDYTTRYPVADVQNVGFGLLLSWANGRYFKLNTLYRHHVQEVGIDQSLTTLAQAHPAFHPVFHVRKNLMNDAALGTLSGEVVTVVETYDYLGPNPDFLLLGAVGRYAIRGIIFADKNYDGYLDPDEGGMRGISLRLRQGNSIVAETTTTRDGSYIFMFDEPGDYVVELDQPLNTRTSDSLAPSGIDPERHSFTVSQPHNNPEKTDAWDVVARTPSFSINDNNMTERVIGGLSPLPILTWYPAVVHVVNPLPGQNVIIPFTLTMDQIWSPFMTLTFEYYPSSNRVRVLEDFSFPNSVLIGGTEHSTRRFLGMTVYHNPRLRGSESVLVDFDRFIFGKDVHTASQWFVVVFHEREPEPPQLGPSMTDLYVGNIAGDNGSPAVLFREAGGQYRFAAYFRGAGSNGEAFFADVELEGRTFSMDTPAGTASGYLLPDQAEGIFDQSGARFTLEWVNPVGPFAAAAGLYFQEEIEGQDWDIFGVLTPEGRFLFYSEFEGEGAGGGLLLNERGEFSIRPAPGALVRGSVSPEEPFQIAAIYEEPGFSAPILLDRITRLDTNLTGPLAYMTARGRVAASDWVEQDWFGWFHLPDLHQRWVYHLEWGWIWVSSDSYNNFWFYVSRHDLWLWTTREFYPYLSSPTHGGWIYYIRNSPQHWIRIEATGEWIRLIPEG